ncbi:hypothetical protein GQ55_8G207000 [Panicum hallii var. hallii]|uniref:Uncharacterized protein n=1 Tax=Panicum hallii var. hallii TaxID=1504633 RepID=A0A2T7CPK2_9POAL|nr:hypothetical protein GQ55_8G206600 [Panicum hallii var. hallii]PUZ45254.1 hypothetical protein GQ55_8G206800 [Panicum hallii var. hallii]PUZ45255.1 hypothetical protein GQ55_8G207000 [Panicum hallii var. hallii]
MPGRVPTSWPNLIGMDVVQAVAIIRRERPDLRVVRVLPPGQAPSPPQRGMTRVVIHNDNNHRVIAPAPYIG